MKNKSAEVPSKPVGEQTRRVTLKPGDTVMTNEMLECIRIEAMNNKTELENTKRALENMRTPPQAPHRRVVITFKEGSEREFVFQKVKEVGTWIIFSTMTGHQQRINKKAVLFIIDIN